MLWSNGLYCRADDRGEPVVQLAPPLTIGRAEIDEIVAILRKTFLAANDYLKVLIEEEEQAEMARKLKAEEEAAKTPVPPRNPKKIL